MKNIARARARRHQIVRQTNGKLFDYTRIGQSSLQLARPKSAFESELNENNKNNKTDHGNELTWTSTNYIFGTGQRTLDVSRPEFSMCVLQTKSAVYWHRRFGRATSTVCNDKNSNPHSLARQIDTETKHNKPHKIEPKNKRFCQATNRVASKKTKHMHQGYWSVVWAKWFFVSCARISNHCAEQMEKKKNRAELKQVFRLI